MRVVSWNIRQGGGKRAAQISHQLTDWKPDVVALSEFCGTPPSQSIAESLHTDGLTHQLSTVDPKNASIYRLLLASRYPLRLHPAAGLLEDSGRWIHATLDTDSELDLMVMHVPNRDEGDKYGFHAAVVEEFQGLRDRNAIALGDTNTGVPGMDEESSFFNRKEGDWYAEINRVGWCDLWREQNPEAREFTYYSSYGNGFRLDQLFAAQSIREKVQVFYDWGTPTVGKLRGPSDHAAMIVDLDCELK